MSLLGKKNTTIPQLHTRLKPEQNAIFFLHFFSFFSHLWPSPKLGTSPIEKKITQASPPKFYFWFENDDVIPIIFYVKKIQKTLFLPDL